MSPPGPPDPGASPCARPVLRRQLLHQPVDAPGPRRSTGPGPCASGRRCGTPTGDSATSVDEIEPVPGLPDLVFTANAGLVIGGRVAGQPVPPRRARRRGGRVRSTWFSARGFEATQAGLPNEGEGDYLVTGHGILAGSGFRSDTGRASRGGGLLRPAGRAPAARRPPLLPPRHRPGRARRRHRSPTGPAPSAPTAARVLRRAVPRRRPGHRGRRRRLRAQRLLRRAPRRAGRPAPRPLGAAGRAGLRARPGRHVRAAEGRRLGQVLHARAARGRP